ncbi:pyridoxamine 5'-phosphate oxidase family protein [bacterium]|nr:MAG: pyridoxamine 5'-phosphate oxidase family protein [bacterium]
MSRHDKKSFWLISFLKVDFKIAKKAIFWYNRKMEKITPEIKKLIEGNALAIATTDDKGNPHCVTVGYPKVVSGSQIVLSAIYIGETLKNIERNNNVALAVWSRNWEEVCEGYELRGKAEYFTSGKWKKFVDNLPENKDEKTKGAVLVTVEKIKRLA